MQQPLIIYAKKVIDLLQETTVANAKLALRIADVLLDYREKVEFSSLLGLERAEVLISSSQAHLQSGQDEPLNRQSL